MTRGGSRKQHHGQKPQRQPRRYRIDTKTRKRLEEKMASADVLVLKEKED